MKGLDNPDVFGYYDFHWKRGINQHFSHLLAYSNWAKERDAVFYTWLSCTSGLPGKGNYNRNLWSANTGIACGLKGIMWFLADDMMDRKTLEWTETGKDIIKVNKEIAPLAKEIAKLGHPTEIFATPITKKNARPITSRCRSQPTENPIPSNCHPRDIAGVFKLRRSEKNLVTPG